METGPTELVKFFLGFLCGVRQRDINYFSFGVLLLPPRINLVPPTAEKALKLGFEDLHAIRKAKMGSVYDCDHGPAYRWASHDIPDDPGVNSRLRPKWNMKNRKPLYIPLLQLGGHLFDISVPCRSGHETSRDWYSVFP